MLVVVECPKIYTVNLIIHVTIFALFRAHALKRTLIRAHLVRFCCCVVVLQPR